MQIDEQLSQRLTEVCTLSLPDSNHEALLANICQAIPEKNFHLSLSRDGWHRLGGVFDNYGERVAYKLEDWYQAQGLDLFDLVEKYQDSGYQVSTLNGTTHYFTACTGNEPGQFIQLEIEEITEVVDRNLIEPSHIPDTVDELLEPDDFPKLEPARIIRHYYRFRRITDIEDFIARMGEDSEHILPVHRWFTDWIHSSASEKSVFCEQWVMALREYTDGYGEPRMEAKPISASPGELDELDPDITMRGSKLANAIHAFDRQAGYPMAWYFYMLTRKKVSPRIAEAIHNDLQGAYAYLAPRDVIILNQWIADPYSV